MCVCVHCTAVYTFHLRIYLTHFDEIWYWGVNGKSYLKNLISFILIN
jgi:hypothetical protein